MGNRGSRVQAEVRRALEEDRRRAVNGLVLESPSHVILMRARKILAALSLGVACQVALPAASTPSPPAPPPPLTRGELRWLGRVTFGIDSAIVVRYRTLGRQKFLDQQL